MRANLKQGDWLIGISPKSDGNQLVYAMRISQRLSMNDYFHDRQFESKKPKFNGTQIERCGDNLYYQRGANWRRLKSPFHRSTRDFDKDKGCPVFVSNHFYYFGERRFAVPDNLKGITRVARGISYKDHPLADKFVTWLEANYKPGRRGKPRDMLALHRRTAC